MSEKWRRYEGERNMRDANKRSWRENVKRLK